MNSPDPAYDQKKLHELASAALDGTASESQLKELTEQLRESPDARDEYLKLMDLHAVLSTELVASPSNCDAVVESIPLKTPTARTSRRRLPVAIAAALAASLLIAVTWFRPDGSAV